MKKVIVTIPLVAVDYADERPLQFTMAHDNLVVSDGYHTVDELYDHRVTLYIALCRMIGLVADKNTGELKDAEIWRSHKHADGSMLPGWFIMGIGKEKGQQITYHLPISRWSETDFAETLDTAPEWDGHTSQDVLERLKTL